MLSLKLLRLRFGEHLVEFEALCLPHVCDAKRLLPEESRALAVIKNSPILFMFRLDQKNAVVTGAGSGIGRAIAELFARQGATVWVLDRDEKGGEATVAEIVERGGRAHFEPLDVSDGLAAEVLSQRLPGMDVLVNNAGIGHVGNLLATGAEDLDRLHAVNVRGPFNLCKAFVPPMLERGSGSVIMLASIGGIVGVRERLAYTVSKHAVVGLTRALALDHSATGVRFNAICPGRVETPFVKARLAEYPDPQAAYREMASTQLNGRMVRSEEVAAAALYLAAEESAMVTGSCQMIDGGWSAGK
jgi:2-keto-3-deoxy-L-fuconate dehydrogenase